VRGLAAGQPRGEFVGEVLGTLAAVEVEPGEQDAGAEREKEERREDDRHEHGCEYRRQPRGTAGAPITRGARGDDAFGAALPGVEQPGPAVDRAAGRVGPDPVRGVAVDLVGEFVAEQSDALRTGQHRPQRHAEDQYGGLAHPDPAGRRVEPRVEEHPLGRPAAEFRGATVEQRVEGGRLRAVDALVRVRTPGQEAGADREEDQPDEYQHQKHQNCPWFARTSSTGTSRPSLFPVVSGPSPARPAFPRPNGAEGRS